MSAAANVTISSSDLLALVEASMNADYTAVRRVSSRIASAIAKSDMDKAKKLRSAVRKSGVPLRASGYAATLPVDPKSRSPLIEEQPWPITPAFLEDDSRSVFETFIRDANSLPKLQAHGLAGRMNLLLSGPPGTGKSLLAGHVAAQLSKPFYIVRLDSLISSLLGDTAKNIRSAFDYVAESNGVLFLDEFDAIAKLRDDKHELGELKRVVNTLLQSIDAFEDGAILIAATNHESLLDQAVWRRFPYKMHLGSPSEDLRKHLWSHFLFADDVENSIIGALSKISVGLSGSDIESISVAARRTAILNNTELDLPSVIVSVLNTQKRSTTTIFQAKATPNQRKDIASTLVREYQLSTVEAAGCLGVSRQSISAYLKE